MDDLIDYLAVDFLTDRPKTLLLCIINKWSNIQYNIRLFVLLKAQNKSI